MRYFSFNHFQLDPNLSARPLINDKLGYALRPFGDEIPNIAKHDYDNAIMIVTITRITRIFAVISL